MRRNINWKSSSLPGQAVALSDIFRIVARLARVALRRQPTSGSSSVSPVRQILDLSVSSLGRRSQADRDQLFQIQTDSEADLMYRAPSPYPFRDLLL